MGIPGFYGRWLTKHARHVIKKTYPRQVSSLALDLNGIIHMARINVYGTPDNPRKGLNRKTEEQLLNEMYLQITSQIEELIQIYHPRDALIVAIDGVAPAGKIKQQRSRRFINATPDFAFNSNAITPGTNFMFELDTYLRNWFETVPDTKIIYSSHLVPGEGEHKIMDIYRDGSLPKDGNHVIYGLDADLIMLSLLSPLENMYVSRESVDSTIYIKEFRDFLKKRTGKDNAVADFVLMSFFLGNDFLPNLPSFEATEDSVEELIDQYTSNQQTLTKESEINWEGVKELLGKLSKSEGSLLKNLIPAKPDSNIMKQSIKDGKFYPKLFYTNWYGNEFKRKNQDIYDRVQKIISTYEPSKFDQNFFTLNSTEEPPVNSKIILMTLDYLRTLSWTFLYYFSGTNAINEDWVYPHYHAPMITTLAGVIGKVPINGYKSENTIYNFTALHQLLSVLPIGSKDLLPESIRSLMDEDSPIRDMYPSSVLIEKEEAIDEHKAAILLPNVSRRRIYEIVSTVIMTQKEADLWKPQNNVVFQKIIETNEPIVVRIKYQKKKSSLDLPILELDVVKEKPVLDLDLKLDFKKDLELLKRK